MEPLHGNLHNASVNSKFLEKLRNIIELNIANPEFGVEELGKEIGMSRSHLHRKITALTGKSPSRFIRSYKLEKAKIFLKNNSGTISEISDQLGFSSAVYFSQVFSEEFGYPPSELRKSEKKYPEESRRQRTLAAVVLAKVINIEKIFSIDENKGLDIIDQICEETKKLCNEFGGQFIKKSANQMLSTFPSSSDASTCSMALLSAASDIGVQLKIVIHQGEVVMEEKDVSGETVNLTYQIIKESDETGLWITEPVYRTIRNKKTIAQEIIDRITIKSFDEELQLYQLRKLDISGDGTTTKKGFQFFNSEQIIDSLKKIFNIKIL